MATSRMAAMRSQAVNPSKERFRLEMGGRVRRFKLVWLAVLLVFVVIVGRLVDVQIIESKFYQNQAKKLRSQSLVLYDRGRILDRNGVILAQDTILYDIFAHPHYFYKVSRQDIAAKIAPILNQPADKVVQELSQPFTTIALAHDLPKNQAEQIIRLHLPGIEAPRKMIRRYPQGSLAAHILGYVNEDASISTGIEKSGESILRTPPAMPGIELTGHGDFVDVENIKPEWVTNLPKAQDVQLTIDSRIQFAAESALARGLDRVHSKRGAIIVMNPRTGEILAFAVIPTFNPETYYKSPPENLNNWAITDVYPPGSTFKILTIASGLETGVINRNSRLHDTGFVKMDGFTIKNYDYAKRGAPGMIDLVALFQHSSNVGSLLVSLMMDPAEHYRLIHGFGMGEKTNIDIPGESAGILHPPSQWDHLTHATIGFGYGLAATPLQMATAVSAIANDGIWVTPHLMRDESHVVRRRVLSAQTAHTVTELLTTSIEVAKTSSVRLPGFHLAGKTGTSRKPNANGRGYSNDVFTSFVGYFPADNPQVLTMVVVDSPHIGEAWGSTVAGPIFKDLATQMISYLALKPDPHVVYAKPRE